MTEDVVGVHSRGSWRHGVGVSLHRHPLVRRAVTVAVVVYLLYGLAYGAVNATMQWGWYGLGLELMLGLAGTACCLAVLRQDRPRGNAVLLAAAMVVGLAMHGLIPFSGFSIIYLVPCLAAFRVHLWRAGAIGVIDAAGVLVVSLAVGLPGGAVVGSAIGVVFTQLFAILVRQLIVTSEKTDAAARARAGEAVLAERARLAREIHDILAHSLSAQIMHLEGARLLLQHASDPATALDRVTRAGELARSGLEETRRAVDALRGDELSLPERLQRLASEYRSEAGAGCRVTVSEKAAGLAPEARLAVVRTAQEALTNVRKHAPGAEVTVALRGRGPWYELDVRDSGGAPGELTDTGSGYGLAGMRERAELLGGSLDARPEGTGFQVLLRVPA